MFYRKLIKIWTINGYFVCALCICCIDSFVLFTLYVKHTHTYTMHLWLYLLCRWFYLPDTFFNFSYFQFVVASSLVRFSFSFLLSSLHLFIHSSWLFIRYISLVGFSYVFFVFFFILFLSHVKIHRIALLHCMSMSISYSLLVCSFSFTILSVKIFAMKILLLLSVAMCVYVLMHKTKFMMTSLL